jgi:hypothetical protein
VTHRGPGDRPAPIDLEEITMSEKFEATFHPGGGPLPQREPFAAMEALAEWGQPPPDDVVPGIDTPEAYRSPGRPPWVPPMTRETGVSPWVWALAAVGTLLMSCGIVGIIVAPPSDTSPVRFPVQAVTTSGECKKRLIGSYALIATVTARNGTGEKQTGEVWVSWPVTGEAARTFSKTATLSPGESVEFPVSEPVNAETWYQTGQCTMGWTSR